MVVGEVLLLLTPTVYRLPIDLSDIPLFGAESRLSAPLLVEDNKVGESWVGCSRQISVTRLGFGLTEESLDRCPSKSSKILSILFKSST